MSSDTKSRNYLNLSFYPSLQDGEDYVRNWVYNTCNYFPSSIFFPSVNKIVFNQVLKDYNFTEIAIDSSYEKFFKRNNKDTGERILGRLYFSERLQSAILLSKTKDNAKVITIDNKLVSADIVNFIFIYNYQISECLDAKKTLTEAMFYHEREESQINFLCSSSMGFSLHPVSMKPVNINLDVNYGTGFVEIDKQLREFLMSDKTGLVLLHGAPGTGKSYYIRHLISSLDKKIIYIPPHMVHRISDPEFLGFMLEQKNFILVIEDAEEIVTNREEQGSAPAVANLLNMTDGILGDCLNVKVIATFNMKKENLDNALLRKGRLALEHQFDKLSVEDANRVFANIKKTNVASEPMTLAEIYNADVVNHHKGKKTRKIGFGQ
jgi:predicted AAA+ superfamily ATPase